MILLNSKRKILLLLLIAGSLVGCRTQKFYPTPELSHYTEERIDTSETFISLPLEATFDQKELARKIKKSINRPDGIKRINSKHNKEKFKVLEPQLTLKNNTIIAHVPFEYYKKKELNKGDVGAFFTGSRWVTTDRRDIKGYAEIEVNLSFTSKYGIKADVEKSRLRLTKVEFGGIEALPIAAAYKLFGSLHTWVLESKIKKEVEEYFSKNGNFKKVAAKGWSKMQDPIKIGGNSNLKLKIIPRSIGLSEIRLATGKISYDLILKGFVNVSDTIIKVKKRPLPKLSLKDDPKYSKSGEVFNNHQLEVNFNLFIPYDSIATAVEGALKQAIPIIINADNSQIRKLDFSSYKCYPFGDSLIILTEFKAEYHDVVTLRPRGTLYIICEPKIQNNCLLLDNMNVLLESGNLTSKVADEKITTSINQTMKKSLKTKYCLDKNEIDFLGEANGVKYSFKTFGHGVSNIALTRKHLYINFFFNGKGNIWTTLKNE